jgi:hypothetical protein
MMSDMGAWLYWFTWLLMVSALVVNVVSMRHVFRLRKELQERIRSTRAIQAEAQRLLNVAQQRAADRKEAAWPQ